MPYPAVSLPTSPYSVCAHAGPTGVLLFLGKGLFGVLVFAVSFPRLMTPDPDTPHPTYSHPVGSGHLCVPYHFWNPDAQLYLGIANYYGC